MQVVPVIDLKSGQVVRAVGGHRDQYQPLVSPLVESPEPLHVARRFYELGFRSLYIADLDAIELGSEHAHWATLTQLLDCGLALWVDIGLRRVTDIQRLGALRSTGGAVIKRLIVGLESVSAPALLRELASAAGGDRAVFSLDLVDGCPRAHGAGWLGLTAAQIARLAIHAGFRRVLLLDVRRVGAGQGPTSTTVFEELRAEHPLVEWSLGGGVRGPGDLVDLERAGFSHALISTALHGGQIAPPGC